LAGMPGKMPNDAPPAAGLVELVRDAEHFERVVRQGLLTAATSVDIATADFKTMLVPVKGTALHGSAGRGRRAGQPAAVSIIEALRQLAARGVEIRLLHAGVPSGPALQELRHGLPDRVAIRRCPRLHAKTVVIDCQGMYLGSANLTGAGLGAKGGHRRNFEWGVWTRSPTLIDAVLAEFNTLWEGRRCTACRRHANCPVPLEEPGG